VVLTPKEGGGGSASSGYVLSVFRRSSSGQWLLARDANLVAGAGNPDRV
jgi:ketosteroid isomerase-like protein